MSEVIRELFVNSTLTRREIAAKLGLTEYQVDNTIKRQRKKNPSAWPKRRSGIGHPWRTNPSRHHG